MLLLLPKDLRILKPTENLRPILLWVTHMLHILDLLICNKYGKRSPNTRKKNKAITELTAV